MACLAPPEVPRQVGEFLVTAYDLTQGQAMTVRP